MRCHIQQSGMMAGMMVRCPAQYKCTLTDDKGNPVHHGDFVSEKQAMQWNELRRAERSGWQEPMDASVSVMQSLEHDTALPDNVVERVIENEAASQNGALKLPHNPIVLQHDVSNLLPKLESSESFDASDKEQLWKAFNTVSDLDAGANDLDSVVNNCVGAAYPDDDARRICMTVAHHRNVSVTTLRTLANTKLYDLHRAVIESPNVTPDVLDELAEHDDEVGTLIAANRLTRPRTLRRLADSVYGGTARCACENPNLSQKDMTELSFSDRPAVREGIARNPNVPLKVVIRLTQDENADVRKSAERNARYRELVDVTKPSGSHR